MSEVNEFLLLVICESTPDLSTEESSKDEARYLQFIVNDRREGQQLTKEIHNSY